MIELDAAIVAVTVHPSVARVRRRGRLPLPAGSSEVVVAGLPVTLDESSVRVTGRSGAGAQVVGVEVAHRRLAGPADARVAEAEQRVRAAADVLGAVQDEDTGELARQQLARAVADRGGRSFAEALAEGRAEPQRVTDVAASLAETLRDSAARRRLLATQAEDARRALEAAQADLDRLRASGRDRRVAVVAVEAASATEVELDIEYVVHGASWQPTYDVRVDGDTGAVDLTWGASIAQATGEDWPACELTVSTSEPTIAGTVPELDPWWIGVWRPASAALRSKSVPDAAMAAPAPAMAMAAPDEMAFEVADLEAVVLDTTLAASWVLPRPTAVPGDGAPHRVVLARAELPGHLDHITAPVQSESVLLRAVITNDTGRALLAGQAAVFLDGAFAGTAAVAATAPGGELELALGVDDRVAVERTLVRRETEKRRLGSGRGRSETWTTTVTNHRTRPIHLLVRDRVPHSRDAEVKVVDVRATPAPAEQDDLGRIEWRAEVAPGQAWTAELSYGVEHPKDVRVAGWLS